VQTKAQLLGYVVWLSSVNDAELLEGDRILSGELCSRGDRPTVREAGRLVDSVLKSFVYIRSPEFAAELAGKSEEFARMRAKLTDAPAKRPEQRRRAERALAALLVSDEAYDLFPAVDHPQLDTIRELFQGLKNPN
jgi:hypothetical protein